MGLLGDIFGRKARRADRILGSTGIEEADVLYAGTWDVGTRRSIVEELDSRGLNVTDLRPSMIGETDGELLIDGVNASELEDTVVFYRQASFKDTLSGAEITEKMLQMQRLEEEYGIEFVNSQQGSALCSDKEVTKREMENIHISQQDLKNFAEERYDEGEKLDDEWIDFLEENWENGGIDDSFLRVPETYQSYEQAREELERDGRVVKKPVEGKCGRDIKFLELSEIEEFQDGFTYEEFIDHYSDTDEYREVADSRIWVAGDETVTVDRQIDSSVPEPTNISNGGEYVDDPVEAGIEEELSAHVIAEQLDMDVFAIDCVRRIDEEGEKEILPYEVNATPGTKLNSCDACDNDLYGMTADVVEERLEAGISHEPEIGDPVVESAPAYTAA